MSKKERQAADEDIYATILKIQEKSIRKAKTYDGKPKV